MAAISKRAFKGFGQPLKKSSPLLPAASFRMRGERAVTGNVAVIGKANVVSLVCCVAKWKTRGWHGQAQLARETLAWTGGMDKRSLPVKR
jgi:hypothetical protein